MLAHSIHLCPPFLTLDQQVFKNTVKPQFYPLAEGLCFWGKLAFELTVKNLNLALFTGRKFHKCAKRNYGTSCLSLSSEGLSFLFRYLWIFLYVGVCSLTERGGYMIWKTIWVSFTRAAPSPLKAKALLSPNAFYDWMLSAASKVIFAYIYLQHTL